MLCAPIGASSMAQLPAPLGTLATDSGAFTCQTDVAGMQHHHASARAPPLVANADRKVAKDEAADAVRREARWLQGAGPLVRGPKELVVGQARQRVVQRRQPLQPAQPVRDLCPAHRVASTGGQLLKSREAGMHSSMLVNAKSICRRVDQVLACSVQLVRTLSCHAAPTKQR